MISKVSLLYGWFIRIILIWLPDHPVIMRFRGWLYGLAMKSVGENFQVSSTAQIYGLHKLSVGSNVFIATNVVINCGETVIIESEVLIGIAAVVVSGNHTILNGSYRFGTPTRSSISIGFGSWVSANCVLTSGSALPKGSLLAANSVLNKKFAKTGVYAGIPARKIK